MFVPINPSVPRGAKSAACGRMMLHKTLSEGGGGAEG